MGLLIFGVVWIAGAVCVYGLSVNYLDELDYRLFGHNYFQFANRGASLLCIVGWPLILVALLKYSIDERIPLRWKL